MTQNMSVNLMPTLYAFLSLTLICGTKKCADVLVTGGIDTSWCIYAEAWANIIFIKLD